MLFCSNLQNENMKIDVVVEWSAGLRVQLQFDEVPTAGMVLRRLINDNVFDSKQFKYAHIYGYKNNEKVQEDKVLLSNAIEAQSRKYSIWNWIFPIIFWCFISVPFVLRKFGFSMDVCAVALVAICALLSYVAYKFNFTAIFYPKRTTHTLDKYEIALIFFFYTLSPKVGQEELEQEEEEFDESV
jgi:hypothetical protein